MADGPRVAIKTLGCKLNQYESEQIREDFEALGFQAVDFDQPAEVYLINSCTVTHRTDRDTRRLSRQARRRQPEAMIIVTGCYVQMQPEVVEGLGVVDLVARNERKGELARAAAEWLEARGRLDAMPGGERDPQRLVSSFPDNTRAFVKVQTGCNANCAYCIIRKARGPSRSIPPDLALRQAERLALSGHPEVVLVGIHLGVYGHDLDEPGLDLDELTRRMCALEALPRLRLSSIEPMEISDDLIAMVAAGGRALRPDPSLPGRGMLCRHLHIPMQSGCDETLRRMRRPYDSASYGDVVRRVHEAEPLAAIGADVMTGFPGETDEEFQQTEALVRELPVSYLHVFTYSARPGTDAAEMPDQVDPEVRKQRTHVLRALSRDKRRAFAERAVGETLEVVVETPREEGRLSGISDNYLRVAFEGSDELIGELVPVEITRARGAEAMGRLI
ncbi:MAG: tRNA (N(6)-L-threonylcarbamoyladenosine(37)-C(2))-methylthiotransferase MtaB [Armatimonadota bacterium]|nr:tRNA (N(6)-L-threonylcarbamoyladenosine(37)-C(2))-methylthiotransferase MtaB [Armatimonadota bacterium]